MDHDLMKTAEVAQACRVTPKTVWSWHKKGRLPGIELPGGELRFRRHDVEAILSPTDTEGAA
jgi:excisionase family DNA binding protein